jgi:acyl dehydratase
VAVGINRDYVGRTFAAEVPFVVGREHIRQFAAAVGDDNPLSRDLDAAKAAGYPDLVAPPTFLTTVTMWRKALDLGTPDLNLDYSRVVHGEQRFIHARPVVAGDELTLAMTITGIRDAGRNEVMTMSNEFRTTSGELVATAVATLVSRGTAAKAVAQ